MRLVRTLVPESALDDVTAVLSDNDIDYVVSREDSDRDRGYLLEFPLPTQAVERVLEDLRSANPRADAFTVVASAETVFTEHVDEMEDRFITGTEEDDSIATEEVRTKALDLTPSPRTYYSMTLLSALVATAGLLLDSPAVVVGAMVIAPVVGSALTASVGTVLDDRTLVWEGFKSQLLGLALAIGGAMAFSFGLKSAAFLPPALDLTTTQQIAQRISPGLLSIVIGLCAGAAGAFGLATGVSVSLVGVMIAVALIPAAAAVGIGLAWGLPAVTLGASLLLGLNVLAIHVSGAGVLWYLGYRPEATTGAARGYPAVGRANVTLLAVLAVTAVVLAGAGSVVGTNIAFEQQVNQAADEVLGEEAYAALDLVSVRVEAWWPGPAALAGEREVRVVVDRPADRAYPALSRRIADHIAADTGRSVTVVVEFVETQTADAPDAP